eukprot:IDg10t1
MGCVSVWRQWARNTHLDCRTTVAVKNEAVQDPNNALVTLTGALDNGDTRATGGHECEYGLEWAYRSNVYCIHAAHGECTSWLIERRLGVCAGVCVWLYCGKCFEAAVASVLTCIDPLVPVSGPVWIWLLTAPV